MQRFVLTAVAALALLAVAFAVFGNVSQRDSGESARATRCASVPATTLDAIEDGLTVQGTSLSRGAALRDGDWWYVAARIDGPGFEDGDSIGVWAMPDKDDPGPIIMAEAFARNFSQWGTQTGAENLGVWMGPALEAADCLR